jgi:hypothetical protein
MLNFFLSHPFTFVVGVVVVVVVISQPQTGKKHVSNYSFEYDSYFIHYGISFHFILERNSEPKKIIILIFYSSRQSFSNNNKNKFKLKHFERRKKTVSRAQEK